MAPRLQNRPLKPAEARAARAAARAARATADASFAARHAFHQWYENTTCSRWRNAFPALCNMQRDSNLQVIAAISWQHKRKGKTNGWRHSKKWRHLQPAEAQAARAAARAARAAGAKATDAARHALCKWYEQGYKYANASIPNMQRDSNLKVVAAIPGWQAQKGEKNGYVMLLSLWSGKLTPVMLKLNYDQLHGYRTGGLTYRELHKQIRETLKLENQFSLRMCPFRPWCRYICAISERLAVPATDHQCRHLLGTTLLFDPYVHRCVPMIRL